MTTNIGKEKAIKRNQKSLLKYMIPTIGVSRKELEELVGLFLENSYRLGFKDGIEEIKKVLKL